MILKHNLDESKDEVESEKMFVVQLQSGFQEVPHKIIAEHD